MSQHILVVDDEVEIIELLETYLSGQGYQVSTAQDGRQLRECLGRHPVDLVLLDIGLPGEDGLTLARYLREHADVGIIMVSGRGEPVDRIIGLEIGADDYVTKPFDLRELLARIRSVLRRLQPQRQEQTPEGEGQVVTFSGWKLDTQARSLTSPEGKNVALTTGEYELLVVLVDHANRVLSRDQLIELLHHREAGPFDRAIDVQVGRLRRKIEADPSNPQLLKAVRGAGYILAAKVQKH